MQLLAVAEVFLGVDSMCRNIDEISLGRGFDELQLLAKTVASAPLQDIDRRFALGVVMHIRLAARYRYDDGGIDILAASCLARNADIALHLAIGAGCALPFGLRMYRHHRQ